MDEVPEASPEQSKPSFLQRTFVRLRHNSCLWYVIVVFVAGLIGGIIQALTNYLPDYLAVLVVYALGIIGLCFVFGMPRRRSAMVWTYFALG